MEEPEKQVKILAETVGLLTERLEQLFKMLDERLAPLLQLAENQRKAVEELELTNQALQEALGDLDAQTDDLAKATSALIEVVTPRATELVTQAAKADEQ
jgi:hypothetical protein